MDSNEQIVSEISQRISQLEGMSMENLKLEMQELKKAIMANPAACLLLKEEDIGAMVSSLRKITGIAIQAASTKKASTTKKAATSSKIKALSAAELAAALDDEDF